MQQLCLKAASQALREGGILSTESDAAKMGNRERLTLLAAAVGKQLVSSSDGEPPMVSGEQQAACQSLNLCLSFAEGRSTASKHQQKPVLLGQ